jgi:lambda repressor-like predicted transcriptional regulator
MGTIAGAHVSVALSIEKRRELMSKTAEKILQEKYPKIMHLIADLKNTGMVERWAEFEGKQVEISLIRATAYIYYPDDLLDDLRCPLDDLVLEYIGTREVDPPCGSTEFGRKYRDKKGIRSKTDRKPSKTLFIGGDNAGK